MGPRLVIKTINACHDCPDYIYRGSCEKCGKTGHRIDRSSHIPIWCPLLKPPIDDFINELLKIRALAIKGFMIEQISTQTTIIKSKIKSAIRLTLNEREYRKWVKQTMEM